MLHYIEVYKFNNFGWVSEREARRFYNPHTVGVYAHYYGFRCPRQDQWPWELQDTFYVGKAGGNIREWRFDDKNGTGMRGQYKSAVYDRFQAHQKMYSKRDPNSIDLLEEKYQDFHRMRGELPENFEVWYNLIAPDPNWPKGVLQNFRAEVALIEAEVICAYKDKWGEAPRLNRDHRSDLTNHIPTSISQSHVSDLGDVTSFFV